MAELPEELPSNAFLASMPWWIVLGREGSGGAEGAEGGGGLPGYLVLDADGSTCLAVFTDEDLALRFVGEAGFDGGPLPVETPEQFLRLAGRLPEVCQYAAFDPPSRVGARARWVVALAEVARALEAAREEGEDGGRG
jgi:hypothetical protein